MPLMGSFLDQLMLITAVIAANRRKPAPAIDRSKAAVDPVAAFKLRCEARAYLTARASTTCTTE